MKKYETKQIFKKHIFPGMMFIVQLGEFDFVVDEVLVLASFDFDGRKVGF
jgi:hypothetical protein